MEPQFIHLRVHSAYSLLEGAMKIPALMSRAAAMGFPAMAVTDTANMFGAKAFSDYAPKTASSRFWAPRCISATVMPMTS